MIDLATAQLTLSKVQHDCNAMGDVEEMTWTERMRELKRLATFCRPEHQRVPVVAQWLRRRLDGLMGRTVQDADLRRGIKYLYWELAQKAVEAGEKGE